MIVRVTPSSKTDVLLDGVIVIIPGIIFVTSVCLQFSFFLTLWPSAFVSFKSEVTIDNISNCANLDVDKRTNTNLKLVYHSLKTSVVLSHSPLPPIPILYKVLQPRWFLIWHWRRSWYNPMSKSSSWRSYMAGKFFYNLFWLWKDLAEARGFNGGERCSAD